MGRKLGSAKQARKLAKLFERWRQAFEAQDAAAMAAARRAIEAFIHSNKAAAPRAIPSSRWVRCGATRHSS